MNSTLKCLIGNYVNNEAISFVERIYYIKINNCFDGLKEIDENELNRLFCESIELIEYSNDKEEIVKEKLLKIVGQDIIYSDVNLSNGQLLYEEYLHFNYDTKFSE